MAKTWAMAHLQLLNLPYLKGVLFVSDCYHLVMLAVGNSAGFLAVRFTIFKTAGPHGMAWSAWHGMAWPAWHGMARMSWHGMAWAFQGGSRTDAGSPPCGQPPLKKRPKGHFRGGHPQGMDW
jgi:hypothetical protein